jgi:cytochrome c-type biogenesis protein CcmH/NrfF
MKRLHYTLQLIFILLIAIYGISTQSNLISSPTTLPPQPEADVVAAKLYCPICDNVRLNRCDLQACIQLRELIKQKLSQGMNEQQVIDYFIAQYGQRIVQPRQMGQAPILLSSNIVSLTIVAIALCLAVVAGLTWLKYVRMRRWS